MTVTARARRSPRWGPTGSPAACSAVPSRAASDATSGPRPGRVPRDAPSGARPGCGTPTHPAGSAWDGGSRRSVNVADHLTGKPVGAEDAQRGCPADRLGDAGRLGEVEGAQPVHRGRDLPGELV